MKYNKIIDITQQSIGKIMNEYCTEIGAIEISITYSDKTKFKETYWIPSDYFKELFRAIKSLVPESEYTPAVLLTSEDYESQKSSIFICKLI